ncbi:g6f-like isoform X2 [Stigmatopora nigra]
MVHLSGAEDWKLVLTASDLEEFSGSGAKPSMRLADPNFQDTGNFSLLLQPVWQDSGFYKCFVEQHGKKIMQKIIHLVIAIVSSIPESPIPRKSTLRLFAKIHPEVICEKISWESPNGTSLKTVLKPMSGFMTKVPQATNDDAGTYKYTIHILGRHNITTFTFPLHIEVNAVSEAFFTTIEHGPPIHTPIQTGRSVTLACPEIRADYIFLYRKHPKTGNLKLLYSRDDWKVKTWMDSESLDLKLTKAPSTIYRTMYAFALKPGFKDGGIYICQMLSNDNLFNQRTLLTVLKVIVPVPSSTLHFLLLTLLLLVLLVAGTTMAVLLWRQKRISRRAIEQSLSVHSGEMENIYENPEDVRQALPQGSFYMDLKPRHDDVYKELDR